MKQPERWLSDPLLRSDVKALLSSARAPRPLPEAVRVQTERQLSLLAGASAGAIGLLGWKLAVSKSLLSVPQLGATLPAWLGSKLVLVTILSLGLAGGVVGVNFLHQRVEPRVAVSVEARVATAADGARSAATDARAPLLPSSGPVSAVAPGAVESAPSAPGAPGVSGLSTGVRRSATRVALADEVESISAPDPLLEEATRLRQARAIREPLDQLRQLTLLTTQFPAGQLQTERQLLQSSVLLRLGRDTEACALLRQVSRAQPHGPYTQRTDQLLQRCHKPARGPTRGAPDPM